MHALLVLLLVPLTYRVYGGDAVPHGFAGLAVLWALLAAAAVGTLCIALAPWSVWRRAAGTLGRVWIFALAAAAVAVSAMQWSQSLWHLTAGITFQLVRYVLSPLIPSLHADARTLVLSSDRFDIRVSPLCSGLEGATLLLAFCGAWLLCLRREYVFPRALILLPAAVLLSFAVNVLRIAALMLIGYAGYPNVAVYGFHSQAGWIAFNASAVLIALVGQRSRWLRRPAPAADQGVQSTARAPVADPQGSALTRWRDTNATAAYLVPFLSILAAGMLSRALSEGFETLYILRVAGAAAALLWAWPRLKRLDWRCSWRGLSAGVAVFAVWTILAHGFTATAPMPRALAAMSVAGRNTWLLFRVLGAVVTVPLAEELAFRGYLMRRLSAVDFESVSFRRTGLAALLLSSLLFGLEEGALWLPGVIAALVFALLLVRTERMGEAVLAHATTNALLAVDVLLWHQWQLW
jgi:exosortase E/protease (VPEID-CTERM system)